jgi:hypothetical protein
MRIDAGAVWFRRWWSQVRGQLMLDVRYGDGRLDITPRKPRSKQARATA